MHGHRAHKRDSERGQASVEFIGVLPAALLVVLLAWQLALAGHAVWLAGSSARVAARAASVGRDPGAAARDAVPGHLRRDLRVERDGDRVRVRLRPALVLSRWKLPFEVGGSAAMEAQRQ